MTANRPQRFVRWARVPAWAFRCAVFSSSNEIRFVRRDLLSESEQQSLFADSRAGFDADAERLEHALVRKVA